MSSKQGPHAVGRRTCANASSHRHHPREINAKLKEVTA